RRVVLLIAVCWIVLLAIVGLRLYVTSDLSGHHAELDSRVQELETRENNLNRSNQGQSFGPNGFWIGLRVEDGKWKWVDGTGYQFLILLTVAVHGFTRTKKDDDTKKEAAPEGTVDTKASLQPSWVFVSTRETSKTCLQDRAQWSIDEYCLGNTDKKCKPCQKGWSLTQPSCYAYNNAQPPIKKTWEEAQEDCRGNNSDLAVAHDSEEKEAIKDKSFGPNGFWIGLRVEDGKWKWVDGSDLTESWISVPDPVDGRCAWFYKNINGWYSVSCGEKRQWICQKKALSV
ncbi:hypothetical protein KUCAC02_014125, partial [Chaenocephalus aceratus]